MNGYQKAKLIIEFNLSNFEQVEKSSVSLKCNYEYGYKDKKQELSRLNKIQFLRLALDRLIEQHANELVSER